MTEHNSTSGPDSDSTGADSEPTSDSASSVIGGAGTINQLSETVRGELDDLGGRLEELSQSVLETLEQARAEFEQALSEQISSADRRVEDLRSSSAARIEALEASLVEADQAREIAEKDQQTAQSKGRSGATSAALREALVELDSTNNQAEVLSRLLEQSCRFAGRAALLLGTERGGELKIWNALGFDDPDLRGRVLSTPKEWLEVLAARETQLASGEAAQLLAQAVDHEVPSRALAVPFILRDSAYALLYADDHWPQDDQGEFDHEAVQLLCFSAAQAMECLTLRSVRPAATLTNATVTGTRDADRTSSRSAALVRGAETEDSNEAESADLTAVTDEVEDSAGVSGATAGEDEGDEHHHTRTGDQPLEGSDPSRATAPGLDSALIESEPGVSEVSTERSDRRDSGSFSAPLLGAADHDFVDAQEFAEPRQPESTAADQDRDDDGYADRYDDEDESDSWTLTSEPEETPPSPWSVARQLTVDVDDRNDDPPRWQVQADDAFDRTSTDATESDTYTEQDAPFTEDKDHGPKSKSGSWGDDFAATSSFVSAIEEPPPPPPPSARPTPTSADPAAARTPGPPIPPVPTTQTSSPWASVVADSAPAPSAAQRFAGGIASLGGPATGETPPRPPGLDALSSPADSTTPPEPSAPAFDPNATIIARATDQDQRRRSPEVTQRDESEEISAPKKSSGASSGSSQVQPPADLTGPGLAFSRKVDPNQDPRHEEARRLARLLVSELKLYNEDEIAKGKRLGDIYQHLREDIDRSRRIYNERIDADVRQHTDFLHQELVRGLADGNPTLLGM